MSRKLTLVLSRSFRVVSVIAATEAFRMMCKGSVEQYIAWENKVLVGATKTYPAPSIVLLKGSHEPSYKKLPLTPKNVFLRDSRTCAYCGSTKNMTLDHVQPRSRKGQHAWDNVTAACFTCNCTKSDLLLEELREQATTQEEKEKWVCKHRLYRPSIFLSMFSMGKDKLPDTWKPFLMM